MDTVFDNTDYTTGAPVFPGFSKTGEGAGQKDYSFTQGFGLNQDTVPGAFATPPVPEAAAGAFAFAPGEFASAGGAFTTPATSDAPSASSGGAASAAPVQQEAYMKADFGEALNSEDFGAYMYSKPAVSELLTKAMDISASDIHLTVGLPPLLRIRGELVPIGDRKLMMDDTVEYADQLLTGEMRKILEEKGEADFSYAIPGVGRYRVNVYRQRKSYAAAIRVIRPKVPTVDELELPQILKDISLKKSGLFLVTGPTGSGKSTTLAAMMRHINENKNCHMITIEDPIEYVHSHGKAMVNQREVHDDTLSFANALRAALREDPDVILVGEMRDFETISTAITASETGHFVMSTLHTSSAAQTIDRVIDVFPPYQQQQIRTQLAAVIEGVLAQRLIRTADGSDRVAAVELMVANDAIRNVIREGKTYQINTIMQTGIKSDMIPMDYYLAGLVKRGILTYQQGVENSFDQETFRRYMSAF